MYCPTGYVSLATLWREFFNRHGSALNQLVRTAYAKRERLIHERVGSPLDYCEDAFLSGLKNIRLTVSRPDVSHIELDVNLGDSASTLFLKATVFESSMIANDPSEAGENRKWLDQMGSVKFEAWSHAHDDLDAWQTAYPDLSSDQTKPFDPTILPYHTLPFAFERGRFIVPEISPPWANDVIDEHFVGRVLKNFAGSTLCVPAEVAEKIQSANRNLRNVVRRFDPDADDARTIGGRPGLQLEAVRAYRRLYPDGHSVSLKSVCNEIATRAGIRVSTRTLQRALKLNQDRE